MSAEAARERIRPRARLGLMDITSSTNARTFIAATVPPFPCGHKVPVLGCASELGWGLLSLLNSAVVDWIMRQRLTTLSMTLSAINEIPVVPRSLIPPELNDLTARLCLGHPVFAAEWLRLLNPSPWKRLWAITRNERTRVRAVLDAAMGCCLALATPFFFQAGFYETVIVPANGSFRTQTHDTRHQRVLAS